MAPKIFPQFNSLPAEIQVVVWKHAFLPHDAIIPARADIADDLDLTWRSICHQADNLAYHAALLDTHCYPWAWVRCSYEWRKNAQETAQAQMGLMGVCRENRRVVLARWLRDLEALGEIERGGWKWGEIVRNKGSAVEVLRGLIERL